MPIYEYRCNDCGTRHEHLQKLGEAPLERCPDCGSMQYAKLVSAAGFQLKGSGWYATDFKGGASKPEAKPAESTSAAPPCQGGTGGCACAGS